MELNHHSSIILSFQVVQAPLAVIISLLCKEGSSFDRRIEGELSFFSLLPIVIPCYDTESTQSLLDSSFRWNGLVSGNRPPLLEIATPACGGLEMTVYFCHACLISAHKINSGRRSQPKVLYAVLQSKRKGIHLLHPHTSQCTASSTILSLRG